jgi:aarF domain-containing kinase
VIPISQDLLEWAKNHENAASQAELMNWTSDAIDALFDVHGYQIFNQGLFNADAHPGNILVIQNNDKYSSSKGIQRWSKSRPKLGLIDYGQCKRLDIEERRRVARLVIGVANDESDEQIASYCRDLGFKTKNDSTKFLSTFARLMFGKFRSEHLKPAWHRALREEDDIVYFPNELSMVYRTSMLLRGLAMSFQLNVSVGEKWREHAENALNQQ